MHRKTRQGGGPAFLAAGLGLLLAWPAARPAAAETKTWIGTFSPGSWQDGFNWDPFGEPGPVDHVLYEPEDFPIVEFTILEANTQPIDTLTMLENNLIQTHGFLLLVDALDDSGLTTLDGAIVEVELAAGPGFITDNLDVINGGLLRMINQGAIAQVDDQMFVDGLSHVAGRGEVRLINVMSVGSVLLDVDGEIEAVNGTLVINVLGGGMMDLGDPGTALIANGSESVYLDGAQAAPFLGHMVLGSDCTITITDPITIYGDVDFDGVGFLNSPQLDFGAGSTIDVVSDGFSFIAGITTLNTGCTVTVAGISGLQFSDPTALAGAAVETDGSLIFDNNTTFSGGTVCGGGILVVNGPLDVFEDTAIELLPDGLVALGLSRPIDIDVNTSATLAIDTWRLGSSNGFDGSATVFGGVLDITTADPWTLTGTITLNTGELRGSGLIVELPGGIDTIGFQDLIEAPLTVGADVVVDVNSQLFITGPTTLAGGTITGLGTLHQDGDLHVMNPSLITVDDLDWDGSLEGAHETVLGIGADLDIVADIVELTLLDGYDGSVTVGSSAGLSVTTPGSWKMDGRLTLDPFATVTGSDVVTRGRTEGDGRFNAVGVTSTGVTAPGLPLGTLRVENGDFEQSTFGAFEIELGGTIPGVTYDVFEVPDGQLALAGTLHVRLRDGFEPGIGQTFTVMTAQSITGALEALLDQAGVTVNQTATTVELTYVGGVNPADVDGDGTVGVLDFLELLAMWGPCPLSQPCPWDLDADGQVGVLDMLILLSLWG